MSSNTIETNYSTINKICEFIFDSPICILGISLLITLVLILFGYTSWMMIFIATILCIFYIINWCVILLR